jgi:hypothetical protein
VLAPSRRVTVGAAPPKLVRGKTLSMRLSGARVALLEHSVGLVHNLQRATRADGAIRGVNKSH